MAIRANWQGATLGANTFTGSQTLPAAGALIFSGRSQIQSGTDGYVLLMNNAGTDFTRLQFGGTTSSFPALKRNSSTLEVIKADDSDWAGLKVLALTVSDGSFMVKSSAAFTNGAAAQTGTLTNAPAAGNPTKWVPISDNGTTRYVPTW